MTTYVKDGLGWQELTSLDRPYANIGGVNISAAGYIPAYGTTLYGTSTPHGLNTGDIVTISGVTPSSFNTTAVANVFDSVQFYFILFDGSTGGAYSSGGTTSTFKPVKNVYANVSGTWNETFAYFETSGGTSYDPGAGYAGVYFTSSGIFTVLNGSRNIEYSIVGGGGGGGGRAVYGSNVGGGGGGGAGRLSTGTLTALSTGSYSITVGAGGAAGTNVSGIAVGGSGGFGGASWILDSSMALLASAVGGTGGGGGGVTGSFPIPTIYGGGGGSSTFAGAAGSPSNTIAGAWGGGGGGQTSAGSGVRFPSVSSYGGDGGAGTASPAWGTPGAGVGGGGGSNNGSFGSANPGSGGAGGGRSTTSGGSSPGKAGYVYLRWPI